MLHSLQAGQIGRICRSQTISLDPYFASVVLLAHFEGSNGSTTFTDSSNSGHTLTAVGNAALTTTGPLMGGSSLSLDGSGDYVTSADSADWAFGSGDFTVEFFVKMTSASGSGAFISSWKTGSLSWYIGQSGGTPNFFYSFDGSTGTFPNFSSSISSGVSYHIAVVRYGNDLYGFVGGVKQNLATPGTFTGTLFDAAAQLCIGAHDGPSSIIGECLIDEVRITKGVARYTATFTPPSSPFPDS